MIRISEFEIYVKNGQAFGSRKTPTSQFLCSFLVFDWGKTNIADIMVIMSTLVVDGEK